MKVSISAAFDGGNIEVAGRTAGVVQLAIRKDPYTELEKKSHMQWFAFRATLDSAEEGGSSAVAYEIVNAKDSSYSDAWPGSTVCVSQDMEVSAAGLRRLPPCAPLSLSRSPAASPSPD